jgi:hypothetical protein
LPNIKYLFEYIKYEIRNFINTEDKEFYKTWDEDAERQKVTAGAKTKNEKASKPSKTSSHKKASAHKAEHKHAEVKSTSDVKWTSEQETLAKKYKHFTGSTLEPGANGKVKYQIKGKNAYQSRTWAEIKKFVDFKSKK